LERLASTELSLDRMLTPQLSRLMERRVKTVSWVETGEAVRALYADEREHASYHARMRNACYEAATKAFRAGQGESARTLSRQGRDHAAKMAGFHDAAKLRIFAARNSSSSSSSSSSSTVGGKAVEAGADVFGETVTVRQLVEMEGVLFLDLHGLHVSESLEVLQAHVRAMRKAWPGAKRLLAQEGRSDVVGLHLHVITGTGHHASDHQSHLGPKVERFFSEEGIAYSVPKWGALLARVI
jgi:hypothetical protein